MMPVAGAYPVSGVLFLLAVSGTLASDNRHLFEPGKSPTESRGGMMALDEPTHATWDSMRLDTQTSRVLLILGVVGVLSAAVLDLFRKAAYLEYIRLYNQFPFDWDVIEPAVDLLLFLGQLSVVPAILFTLGYYGVIEGNRGRLGLVFVFISLWPSSFNLSEVLYSIFGFSISFEIMSLAYFALSFSVALALVLILATARHHIRQPNILYLIIALMVLQPVVSLVLNLTVISGVALNAAQYFLWYGPTIAMFYTKLVLMAMLFFVEFKRYGTSVRASW